MSNQELIGYIRQALAGGVSIDRIRESLEKAGWSPAVVNQAEDELALTRKEAPLPPPPPPSLPAIDPNAPKWEISLKHLTASQVLLFLGGLIVVAAGIMYIVMNWDAWNPVGRILAVALPTLICFVTGEILFKKEGYLKQGLAFLVVAGILIPILFTIAFLELSLFKDDYSSAFNLSVSIISLLFYLLCGVLFRSPIWSVLSKLAFLGSYLFFFSVLGVRNFFDSSVMAWLLIVPGTLFILLDPYYRAKKDAETAKYSQFLGLIVLLFAFIRLLFGSEYVSWLLLPISAAYFGLGMFFEKTKQYCRGLYLLSTGLLFFAIARMSLGGTFVRSFIGDTPWWEISHPAVGWSTVIGGLLFLVTNGVLRRLSSLGFPATIPFEKIFNFFGVLGILGGIWRLGLDGHKLAYETLLLAASLVFIFWSVPRRSRSHLYLGSLFLVVYIFAMGGEYFEGNVGWPVTLTVAGLLSMAIGVVIEKLRKKYFVQ